MTAAAITFPLTALILPLITCGGAWAIAVWALKQDRLRTELLLRLKVPASESKYAQSSELLPSKHTVIPASEPAMKILDDAAESAEGLDIRHYAEQRTSTATRNSQ